MSSEGSASWFASLGKGAKWLAGIVIVAVVGALVPVLIGSFSPPAELGAKLSDISIDKPVTLDEYRISSLQPAALAGADLGAIRLVAATTGEPDAAPSGDVADDDPGAPDDPPKTPDDPPTTPDDPATTPDDPKTKPDDPATKPDDPATTPDDPTPGDPTTAPSDRQRGGGNVIVPLKLGPDDTARLSVGVERALQATPVTLPPSCVTNAIGESCGLRSLAIGMGVAGAEGPVDEVSATKVAQRLEQVFRGSRTEPAPSDPRKRELVGVRVNFSIEMTGFRGGKVDVRWSMIRKGPVRVSGAWLRGQRVLQLRGEADRDSASPDFWVPLPKRRGRYVIRIIAYDGKGTPLARSDTPAFS